MARKGTELRTDFTADDRELNAVHARQSRKTKEFARDWEKATARARRGTEKIQKSLDETGRKATQAAGKMKKGGAAVVAAAAATAAATKQTTDLVDKLILADRADADFEQFQALAKVLEDFRIEADDTSELILELSRAIGEMKQEGGEGTKSNVFRELGIDAEKFEALDPVERVLALSRALEQLEDKDRALANLGQLIGDDLSIRFKPVLELGPEEIAKRLGEVPVTSEAAARKAQEQERTVRRNVMDSAKNVASEIFNTIAGRQSLSDLKRKTTKAAIDDAIDAVGEPEFRKRLREKVDAGEPVGRRSPGNINLSRPDAVELMGVRDARGAIPDFPGLRSLEQLQRAGAKAQQDNAKSGRDLVKIGQQLLGEFRN